MFAPGHQAQKEAKKKNKAHALQISLRRIRSVTLQAARTPADKSASLSNQLRSGGNSERKKEGKMENPELLSLLSR